MVSIKHRLGFNPTANVKFAYSYILTSSTQKRLGSYMIL